MQRRGSGGDLTGRTVNPDRVNHLRLVTVEDPLVDVEDDVTETPGETPPDVVALVLDNSRSADTRAAYALDYRKYFGEDYTPADVIKWAAQPVPKLAADLQKFKADQIKKGMSEATVNRRLASLRSLLSRCHALGYSLTDGRGLVTSEHVTPYRDTRGVSLKVMRRLIALPDVSTEKGKRDLVILRLGLENALRCMEIVAINLADLSMVDRRLRIRGKGRGTRTEWVDISAKALDAIEQYLIETKRWKQTGKGKGPIGTGPLLLSCDHRKEYAGTRLTRDGLYSVVMSFGEAIGVRVTPHKLRHSAITEVLRLNGGNLVEAQDFSRHSDPRTLMIYNDNANKAQGKMTRKLSREL